MDFINNDPVGVKVKKPRSEKQLAINRSLKNAKGRINAAGRKWNARGGPAIAKLLREGAAAANIDAKIAELEVKAAKEEKKAVKAAGEAATAAKAGNSVKAAKKAAEAAGNVAAAGVLAAAANAGKTQKKALTEKQEAHYKLLRNAAARIKTAKKKHSPGTAAKIYTALKKGNTAAANALVAAMANMAAEKAEKVGKVAGEKGVAGKAWQDNIKRARANLKAEFGNVANNPIYGAKLASVMRKGNAASIAAAKNWVRAQMAAKTAKKANKNAKKAGKTAKRNSLNSFGRASAASGSPLGNAMFMNRAVSPNVEAQMPKRFFQEY